MDRDIMALSGMQRFSLRAVLVLVTFLALIVGVVMLQTRNYFLRREVEMLRAEVGYLVPADLSKVNLIEVPTDEQYTWRWRVFAPPGIRFDAGIVTEEIPDRGAPSPSYLGVELPSEQNGVLVTASITNDLDAGYLLTLDFGNGNVCSARTLKSRDEFADGSGSFVTAGRIGPQVCDLNEPIILHCFRLSEQTSPTTRRVPSGNSRGMMFWITPTKTP